MAITRHLAHFILKEHLVRPIAGSTLLLGRQVVFMTPDQAQATIEEAGVKIRTNVRIEYDKNDYGRKQNFISDACFFALFSDCDVLACDVSDFEQADLIFDLSAGLPPGMEDRFDFIYNGSVLDNVFDPAACLRNVTRMLKTSGVALHYEGAAHSLAAYLKFTAEWFFDYYAVNHFADCQAYLCTYDDFYNSPWRVLGWDPFYQSEGNTCLTSPHVSGPDATVVAVSEKGVEASVAGSPIQGLYRSEHSVYLAAHEKFRRSERRIVRHLDTGTGTDPKSPSGYRDLGSIG